MGGFLCAIPLIGSLNWACPPPPPFAVGYVEGEYILVAPIETATISSVDVRRGDRVAADQPLAQLERRDAEIAVAEASAALARAESDLANLHQGRRPEEIAVVEAGLASAVSQLSEAQRVLRRQSELLSRGISTQADFDAASTTVELGLAKVAEFEADLAVARLPARPDEIAAAQAAVRQTIAGLDQANWRLENRTLAIGTAGEVFDVIRNAGEVAGPQAPVLSILPDHATKLRVYVPEAARALLSIGTRLIITCDGCAGNMTASVIYIADNPEFTPPVIYSQESRQRLVYLVEARPDEGASALGPGQIVDVDLESAAE